MQPMLSSPSYPLIVFNPNPYITDQMCTSHCNTFLTKAVLRKQAWNYGRWQLYDLYALE